MAFTPVLPPPRPLPSQLDTEVRETFGDTVANNSRLSGMARDLLNMLPSVSPPNLGGFGGVVEVAPTGYIQTSGGGTPREEYVQVEITNKHYVAKSELDIAIREQGFCLYHGKKILFVDAETGMPSHVVHHPNEAARKRLLAEYKKTSISSGDDEPKYNLKEETL